MGALIEYMNSGLKVGAKREIRNAKGFSSKAFDILFDKNKDIISKFSAFDYVIGSRDRHAENWKSDQNGRFALIDHGQTFREKKTLIIRSNFLTYSKRRKIKISEAIGNEWDNKWPEIESLLKSNKIGPKGITYTKERFDELIVAKNGGKTFDDLSIKSKD